MIVYCWHLHIKEFTANNLLRTAKATWPISQLNNKMKFETATEHLSWYIDCRSHGATNNVWSTLDALTSNLNHKPPCCHTKLAFVQIVHVSFCAVKAQLFLQRSTWMASRPCEIKSACLWLWMKVSALGRLNKGSMTPIITRSHSQTRNKAVYLSLLYYVAYRSSVYIWINKYVNTHVHFDIYIYI